MHRDSLAETMAVTLRHGVGWCCHDSCVHVRVTSSADSCAEQLDRAASQGSEEEGDGSAYLCCEGMNLKLMRWAIGHTAKFASIMGSSFAWMDGMTASG